ncbi:hypothetical protein BDQ17DRAFT_1437962 [Cyathus striatus]|nr:hypothetical protein BDQ17DRAFT_1437962 [Cyathus striatus]
MLTHSIPQFSMVASEATLVALAPAHNPSKKTLIAAITPGFKVDALDTAIPPCVDAAFKAYAYVPYSALSKAAFIKAL